MKAFNQFTHGQKIGLLTDGGGAIVGLYDDRDSESVVLMDARIVAAQPGANYGPATVRVFYDNIAAIWPIDR